MKNVFYSEKNVHKFVNIDYYDYLCTQNNE